MALPRHAYPTAFGFDPDADPGELVTADPVGFIEAHCRQLKGKTAGSLLKLLPWQRKLLKDLQIRRRKVAGPVEALVGVARKNGKSALGAGMALYGLVGEGENGAEVYSCAGDRRQAGIVFEAAKAMVIRDPALSRVVKIYRNSLEVPATGSIYRALSAEAYSKEGYNPSCVIFDEVHVQPDSALWDVMRLGMGTRAQPLMLGITTAGALVNSRGEPSFCHEKYLYGKRVESGEIDDPAFFFRWWEPSDPKADLTDPKVWKEANPSLGRVLRPAALESAARTTAEQEFRAKHLNLWVASLQSWLPAGAWADCTDLERQADGPVVLGFDGSWSNDSTALIGCTVPGDRPPYLFVVGLWERPPGQKGWRVPKGEVMATIRQACADLEVVRVVADPAYWGRELQDLADEGLPIVEFPANSSARMVPATKTFEDTVLDGALSHDGNPALARHVGNARVRVTTAGRVITKDHKDSPLKIDAAVAAVYALDEVRHYRPPDLGTFNVW